MRMLTAAALLWAAANTTRAQGKTGAGAEAETGAGAGAGAVPESESESGAGAGAGTESESETAPNPYPRAEWKARVMAGWEHDWRHPEGEQIADREAEQKFFLRQARVEVKARLTKRVRMEISANVEDDPLRDAYLDLRASRALRLKVGRFRRPFSRLENTGISKLPFRSRGLYNDLIIEDAHWGDRALGAMLWGKLKNPKLRWHLGFYNPDEMGSGIRGLDTQARLQLRIVKGVTVGAHGGEKRSERFENGPDLRLYGAGGDLRLRFKPVRVLVEFDAAQNPNPPPVSGNTDLREPFALGAITFVQVDFELGGDLVLQPVLVAEWLDTDSEYAGDETFRAVIGLNVLPDDGLIRVLPQLEIVRPLGDVVASRSAVASETFYVMLSMELERN
jgi:hypothetical protein